MDANGALRTVWMPDDHIHSYSDDYVMSTTLHAMDTLAELVKSLAWWRRIEVEMENYYYSARSSGANSSFGASHHLHATGVVNWQRGVKSDEEIVFMKNAARISKRLFHGTEKAEPGLRKMNW